MPGAREDRIFQIYIFDTIVELMCIGVSMVQSAEAFEVRKEND